MLYDLQGAQSTDHRDRGIARYVTELALALECRTPSVVDAFLLNPDLPLPGGIEPLVSSGKVRFVDDPGVYEHRSVLHLASPVELAIPIDRLLPPAARAAQVRVVCTVFDLIPFTMPATYLEDPGLRRRYLARIELVRSADRVLAISDFVAHEVTKHLGVPRSRVVSTPLVPSAGFRPPSSAATARATARVAIPQLAERFVLYTGGSDGRKNLEGLLEGWARLPEGLRSQWQLVIAGSLPPLRRNHLEVMAARLGFGDTFLATGFLPEETLIACTQAAELFVFPSLAEGFGLPVAEALACGTPAIGSDATSIVELLPDDARFDPTSPDAIAAAIARALTDDDHRSKLVAWAAGQPRRTWDDVATATVAAYPPTARKTRAPSSDRMRVAFVSPLPPQPGGVAAYSAKLLTSLRSRSDIEIDAYVDGPPHLRSEMSQGEGRPVAVLERVESLSGRYDHVIYSLGNSEFHTGALHALGRRRGVVLAHDVRLINLYRFARWQHPEAVPGGFAATLHGMYDGRLPADLGQAGELSAEEAERWGLLMVRDVVRASTRFLTMSGFAAELARLDARPEHRGRIGTVAFGIGPLVEPDAESTPLVVSFGVLNRLKQGALLVRAFAAATESMADARLVFVGPASDDDATAVRRAADGAGIGTRVDVTGVVDDATYRRWLSRAWVAVQLRAVTNGESSAAIGDCLAAALPTIVTAIGPNRALPDDAVRKVATDVDDVALSTELRSLLSSPERRRAISTAASTHAATMTFDIAADALVSELRGAAS